MGVFFSVYLRFRSQLGGKNIVFLCQNVVAKCCYLKNCNANAVNGLAKELLLVSVLAEPQEAFLKCGHDPLLGDKARELGAHAAVLAPHAAEGKSVGGRSRLGESERGAFAPPCQQDAKKAKFLLTTMLFCVKICL